jgi:NAD(P)H dehydrogenase (quinone)
VTRALVVYCHPSLDSLAGAALARVLTGLQSAGADHRLHDLYGDGFEPEFTADEHAAHTRPGADPSVRPYADDLVWCDTLVLVYPTWWAGQPAMLKGWIDRIWVNGVAWDFPDRAGRVVPLLSNIRRLVVVTTHGSSKFVNAFEGEGGKRTVSRSLGSMCHRRARAHWIALYSVDTCSDERRTRFLDRVERRTIRLASYAHRKPA